MTDDDTPSARFARLRQILEAEEFPHIFTFKFIGNLTPAFEAGRAALESKFPRLQRQSLRPSEKGNHIALTYTLEAHSPDEITDVYAQIDRIPDLRVLL